MAIQANIANALKQSFKEMRKELNTSIVGHIAAFEPSTQMAQAQIGVVGLDAQGNSFTHAVIIECPVQFTGGNQFHIEHQIDAGDECIILFSQRCIDAWLANGGIAEQPFVRFNDKDDAMIIVGLRSQPNAISDFQNNGIVLRDKNRGTYVWLKNDGSIELVNGSGFIKLEAGGTVDINGVKIMPDGSMTTPSTIVASGAVTAPSFTASGGGSMTAGSITSTGDVTAGGISLTSHTHGGVQSGGSNTGVPQ